MTVTEPDGPAHADDHLSARERLGLAKNQLSRLAERLEIEIQGMSVRTIGTVDPKTVVQLGQDVRQMEKVLWLVIETSDRLGASGRNVWDGAIDLEGARAEITRRLARLAEQAEAGSLP